MVWPRVQKAPGRCTLAAAWTFTEGGPCAGRRGGPGNISGPSYCGYHRHFSKSVPYQWLQLERSGESGVSGGACAALSILFTMYFLFAFHSCGEKCRHVIPVRNAALHTKDKETIGTPVEPEHLLRTPGIVCGRPGSACIPPRGRSAGKRHPRMRFDIPSPPPRPKDSYQVLYGRNLPDSTTRTRSPFGSGSRWMSIEKSMALMIPSPNSSWISSLIVDPYTLTTSYQR